MDAKRSIEESLDLLKRLASQRDEIEHQMGQLHLAVRGLSNLISDKAEREGYKAVLDRYKVRTGITDLVCLCLQTTDGPATPKEIRAFIINYGSEASAQQNLLQSIHTILRRMVENGDAVPIENKDGDNAYRLLSFGEKLANIGVQGDAAKRVGRQMDAKFSRAYAPLDTDSKRKKSQDDAFMGR